MSMFDDLLRRGEIRRLPPDPRQVADALGIAKRDAAVARAMLQGNDDWAYTIAYNAMLQAVRAIMFSQGFRPAGRNTHMTVVRFAELALPAEDAILLDRMRRKRHASVYDMAGVISHAEAEAAVARAEEFVARIEAKLGSR
ncbi:MAG: HEPN domain-containing protein [Methanomicrobiaceae archaeon]|nr:HEPN domain-containing protein [Methanomicrobiaceae archaeon]